MHSLSLETKEMDESAVHTHTHHQPHHAHKHQPHQQQSQRSLVFDAIAVTAGLIDERLAMTDD